MQPSASLRAIAHQFGISRDALQRHVKNGHIAKVLKDVQVAHDIAEADDLLGEIMKIQEEQAKIFEAHKDESPRVALEALRDQSKTIELKGKILGAFSKDKETKGTIVIRIDGEDKDL